MRYIIILICIPFLTFAQPPSDRYNAAIFPNYSETQNVLFSTGVPQPNPGGGLYEWLTGLPVNVNEYATTPVDLYMDILEPEGDTLSQRPLIIIAFGGGYLSGSRDYWSIRLLCEDLARRGYVTATVDYRLGLNVFDSDLANRAVYRGLQDARSAVRFFRADAAGANTYRIDPDKIFLGGHSSGAFSALHNAYLEKESERPISTYAWTQDGNPVADMGCLDCAGDNQSYDGQANAVFSLAGALGFTSFIETENDPKVVMFHSEDDDTVPYDSGSPFSGLIWLVVGSDLPDVYGSLPISEQADIVGLPYDFFSYTDREHGVHEDGTSALYSDIIPGISDWFFSVELKPIYRNIAGDTVVCSAELEKTYSLGTGSGSYFDWSLTGGSFVQMNNYSETVEVNWDVNAPIKSLSVVPYSNLDAKGDSLSININIYNSAVNTFRNASTDWNDLNNWSLAHLPDFCEDIVMPNAAMPQDLTLNGQATINSLFVGENLNLTITPAGILNIHQKSSSLPDFAFEVNGVVLNQGLIKVRNNQIGKEMRLIEDGEVDNSGALEIGKD